MGIITKIIKGRKIHPLVKNDYIGRNFYTIVSFLGIVPLFLQLNIDTVYIIIIAGIVILFPHLALAAVLLSKDQLKLENYITVFDPLIFCIWIPLLQFNPLLVLYAVVLIGIGGIVAGGLKLLIARMASMIVSIGIGTAIFGFKFNPDSSLVIITSIGSALIVISYATNFIFYNATKKLSLTKGALKEQKSQLEALSSKLSKYLSPQVFNSIFTGRRDVRIESERKKLTIFFSDIKDFTRTTDGMEPEDLSRLLNSYLNEMTNIVIKHSGTIDKYIGDAIMVFFGDPDTKGEMEDAFNCVSMAIEMRERMKDLRKEWRKQGIVVPLHVRMGINTGYCTVGNFGSNERLDYTIIGGQVNLASRLETNAEPNHILISEDTFSLIQDRIDCRQIGELSVKGIARPVLTYQVIGHDEEYSQQNTILSEQHRGISVEINLEKIESNKVINILNSIIDKINSQ